MELDFYKLTKLSEFDLHIIELGSKQSPPELQEIHRNQLNYFLLAQKAEERLISADINDPEAVKYINAMYSNLLENTHASIERDVIPIMVELAQGNIEILNNKQNMIVFMIFFGHQISRTKNFKTLAINAFVRDSEDAARVADSITNAWWFISYMFGMNMGRSFYLDRINHPHSLLINQTSTPFITADQPIINVHQSLPDEISGAPPQNGDFYYPISPNVAYIICDSRRFSPGIVHISEDEAREFNIKLAKSAHTHIFGNNKKALLPLQQFVGSRRIDRKQ